MSRIRNIALFLSSHFKLNIPNGSFIRLTSVENVLGIKTAVSMFQNQICPGRQIRKRDIYKSLFWHRIWQNRVQKISQTRSNPFLLLPLTLLIPFLSLWVPKYALKTWVVVGTHRKYRTKPHIPQKYKICFLIFKIKTSHRISTRLIIITYAPGVTKMTHLI